MAEAAREWVIRIAMAAFSLAVSLVMVEGLLTAFVPLYGGRDNVAMDGTPVKEWFPPSTVYRQLTNEYDARTTITDKGHRVPGTIGNPDVVFLGDSFTYGFGLQDDETFASIYCARLERACANLGWPGSGTEKQVTRLTQFIDRWQWRPREVKLFVFAMSGSWSAGNDFVDNFNYARRIGPDATSAPVTEDGLDSNAPQRPTFASRIIGSQEFLLERSNLVRRIKYHWGPLLKTALVDAPSEQRFQEALRHTKEGLLRFDALSRRVGFDYQIYLIVPVQDITRRTYEQTLAALNSVSPRPAIPTAQLFLDQPETFYYAYDGHLNPKGAQRVAEFLVSAERGPDGR